MVKYVAIQIPLLLMSKIIYPNPANNFLTIEFNNPSWLSYKLAIYDNLGRKVHGSNFIIDEEIEIDLRGFKRAFTIIGSSALLIT